MARPISTCQCRPRCKEAVVKHSGNYYAAGHAPSVKQLGGMCRCGCGEPVFTHGGYARNHDPSKKHLLSTNHGADFPSRAPEARAKMSAYQQGAVADGTHAAFQPERNAKISKALRGQVEEGTYHTLRAVQKKISDTLKSHGENHSSKRPEMRMRSSRNHCQVRKPTSIELLVVSKLDPTIFQHTGQVKASSYGGPISFDVVCHDLKIGILLHGCYWHKCPCMKHKDESFVVKKRSRDADLVRHAESSGWKVLLFWEHEIRSGLDGVVAAINNTRAAMLAERNIG